MPFLAALFIYHSTARYRKQSAITFIQAQPFLRAASLEGSGVTCPGAEEQLATTIAYSTIGANVTETTTANGNVLTYIARNVHYISMWRSYSLDSSA